MIGQLPKEIGGNYTTGAANVVYELSKKKISGVELFVYGTNICAKAAREHSNFKSQYIGYRFLVGSIVKDMLIHPLSFLKEWRHYRNVDHCNPFRYAWYKANIKKAICDTKPDLIHVHSIGNISPTRFALQSKSTPILLTCHGIFYRGDESNLVLKQRYLGNINLADAYSGLTLESQNEYEQFLGINKERVNVIPNGVDCNKFYYSKEAREFIRKEFGVGKETKVFITVASVQERKGQFAFIKTLEQLNIDFQYWIIGKGPDVSKIEEHINKNSLQGKIKLLGYKTSEQLYKYYSAADVYAHVSTMEGQALCEIEANATGLKIIVNKEIKDTIPDLSLGDYYVMDMKCLNKNELVAWILDENGERCSHDFFDWQIIFERYVALYRSIMKCWNKKS